MATTSCIYQSVTLQPGEIFTLPPGAEVVSITDLASITSEDDCLDTSNLEALECFGVILGDSNPGGSETPVYSVVTLLGIRINDVDYPFDIPVTNASLNTVNLKAAVDETTFGPLITDITMTSRVDGDRGNVHYVAFKSIPSITDDMYFYGVGTGVVSAPPTASIPISFKVTTYDELIASGGSFTYPTCSTAS